MINIIFSFFLCIIVALFLTPLIFKVLKRLKSKQNILQYVDNHKSKQGTLTMGGLIFVLSLISAMLFFSGNSLLSSLVIVITLCYALLGFLDDFLKVKRKHNEGLSPWQKIIGQVGIAVIVAFFVYNFGMLGSYIIIPFTNTLIDISFWIIVLVIIFFIAVTNSVNLTDGLDGLAGYVSLIVIATLGCISLIKYNDMTETLIINAEEYLNLGVICFGLCGSLLVFLLFNANPAKIFMGDTGSLALGGFIASVSAFLQEYLLLIVIGVVYVISAVSDIIQVAYYKLTKKRVFLMAPFHHHLERKGMSETKIVSLYVFITLIVCVPTIVIYLIK